MKKQLFVALVSMLILCGVGTELSSLGGEMGMILEDIDSGGMSVHRKKSMEIIRKDLIDKFGDENAYFIIRGVRGTQQIVAGTRYKLEFLIGESSYGSLLTMESLKESLQRIHTYEVDIIEQLWKNRIEALDCNRIMTKEVDRSESNMKNRFSKFQVNFNKTYKTGEGQVRYQIFKRNMIEAQILQVTDVGTAEYGETLFSDMDNEEFVKWVGEQMNIEEHVETESNNIIYDTNDVPESFDWRSKGAVTKVKNQRGCGSCWAFSTTGNIEGLWKIKKGTLYSLSEQELVDCDTGDNGCKGGLPSRAYNSIVKLGGIEKESSYPYKAEGGPCKFNKSECKVTISGGIGLKRDELYMKSWIYQNCPISIAVNALTMKYYKRGISYPLKWSCIPHLLNHAVLITGYGLEDNRPYWSIKNSWGEFWGENGYIRFYRGAGVCGLNLLPTSAVL